MHTEFKWKFRDFLPPKEYHFCANMYAYYNYFWPENYVYCSKYEFTYSYIKLLQQQFCFIWHRFGYNQQYIQTLVFTIFFKSKYLTSAHAWWQFNWVLLVNFFKSLKFFLVVYPLTSSITILNFDSVYPVSKSTSMDALVTN